ncbi:MAG: O-antigen ligase family protein [Phycisphaerales bacterium]|nr:O-antigen ligase family protein [Phycisphaerales bacterium]
MNRIRGLSQLAALVVIALAVLRCLMLISPQVYFDQDPCLVVLTANGIGPSGSVLLDVLTIAACGVVLIGARRIDIVSVVLALFGAAAVVYHASGDAGDLRVGASWCAAISTGLAAVHFGRLPTLRRLTVALVLGLAGALAVRGVFQVLVEHPQTLNYFREHQEQTLAAQGHVADSTAARSFERRLSQNDAMGWFGLANVYGSLIGAMLVGWCVVAANAWRRVRNGDVSSGLAGLATLGALACAVALVLSHSKGAIAATLLGLALAAMFPLIRGRRWIGPAVIAVVLALVALRGLLGERIDPKIELSILFRWQYLIGAVHAWLLDPVLGTGPDGFKAAYQLVKPALSTEEVTSPHSILFDYLATLGVGGIAWCAMWLRWVSRAGNSADDEEQDSEGRIAWVIHRPYFAAAVAAIIVVIAMRFEAQVLLGYDLVARLLGTILFAGFAAGAWHLLRKPDGARAGALRITLFGVVIVLIAHSQIEMTPVCAGSAALFMLVCGLSGSAPNAPNGKVTAPIGRYLWGGLVIAGAGATFVLGWLPLHQHQTHLEAASRALQPTAQVRMDLSELRPSMSREEVIAHLERIGAVFSAHGITGPLPSDARRFVEFADIDGLATLETLVIPQAVEHLRAADAVGRPSPEPIRQIAQLWAARAAASAALNRHDDEAASLARAEAAIDELLDRFPDRSAHWHLGMLAHREMYRRSINQAHFDQAVRCAERAAALDPHSLTGVLDVADILWEGGEHDEAATWYRRALKLNDLHRLDPLEQLTPERLAEVTTRADGP